MNRLSARRSRSRRSARREEQEKRARVCRVLLKGCGDGFGEGESGRAGGHGLLLCASGAEDQPRAQKQALRGGAVQDMERRRVRQHFCSEELHVTLFTEIIYIFLNSIIHLTVSIPHNALTEMPHNELQ